MKKIILVIAVVFALVSCDSNEIYSDHHTFSDLLWKKTDKPEFKVELKQEKHCQINLDLRIIYGYTYRNIKMDMSITNESGNTTKLPIDFKVRNEDDSYKGDMMGDFIDIQEILISDTTLPAGKYTIEFDQLMDEKTLPFVTEVGLVINDLDKK